MTDIVIIGAGISGCFLARDLSRYDVSIVVLEKENDVASGATMANSAIIHSGHDPKEGTLKAKLNVRGNQMYEEICKELDCTFMRIGAYVLATNQEENETLLQLKKQADSRQVPCCIQTREEIIKKEPQLSDQVISGLWLPSTGILYPWEIAIALMENAISNGVDLKLDEEVIKIEKIDQGYRVKTKNQTIDTKIVINCSGVYADDLYATLIQRKDFSITARKGEYFVLDHMKKPYVNHVLYPVPSKIGKGVLVVPTIHDNILLGPTSYEVDDKYAINNTQKGLDFVRGQLSKIVKDVPFDKMIRTFAGNRPSGNTKDFIIEESKECPDFFNVAAIESPGLASAPAISEMVVGLILDKHALNKKENVIKVNRPKVRVKDCSIDEKNELVKKDKRYAKMICRCEQITEAEIIDAIHRPCGATSVKGVKKRVGPGLGRCQGGFCEPLVVEILARELNKDPQEIVLDNLDSKMLVERTKQNENN